MTTNTNIQPVLNRGRIALKEGETSLVKIGEAMLEPVEAPAPEAEVRPFPAVPAPVVLTDKTKDALARLKDVFAVVQPSERRALAPKEMTAIYAERDVLDAIVELLSGRVEDIKEVVRNHLDVVAETEGRANPATSVRDKAGHYVLGSQGNPERANIPDTDRAWSREFRAGSTTIDTSVVDEMEASGEISRDAYLAMTTAPKRVFDQNKAMLALADPTLRDQALLVVRKMTRRGTPSAGLFVRKAK